MSFNFQIFACRMVMIAGAVVCLSSPQVSNACFPASSATLQQSGITQDLVFVRTSGGHLQNVTSTLYTAQGQTFCVCDGQTQLIVLDYDAGTVRDADGNLIGCTVKEANTPH